MSLCSRLVKISNKLRSTTIVDPATGLFSDPNRGELKNYLAELVANTVKKDNQQSVMSEEELVWQNELKGYIFIQL